MRIVHFVGIGGIGMSALAQFFKDRGAAVSGSDRDPSPVTELLEQKDIRVTIGQRAENVPEGAEVVIYSDAVPEDNPERQIALAYGIPQFSYFQMLGKISEGRRTLAIAGTHGKTTTTGMAARILRDAGASPTGIIGSVVKDFGSNYLHGDSELFVLEACEYRNHLLEMTPTFLVITNLEWDHTDFFPSLTALQETFRRAIARVSADGAVITNPRDENIAPVLGAASCRIIDYTIEPARKLKFPGEFNQMNARAAAAAARLVHPALSEAALSASLAAFEGTWRRFEYKGKTPRGVDVYDDYAHHPTAIEKTLEALKQKVTGPIVVAFHPHLYSRTRDLKEGFARAFKDADQLLLAPIYAAREEDDGTISSSMLADMVRAQGTPARALDSFAAIREELLDIPKGSTIITMGAGDIFKVADALVR